ncbi:MAG: tRNA (adenosine(37)-N6)-threonylcarbamoyltransferase complex transferase subunit TsaD [Candidatus Adiutrix sp.]|jgi:N6-L-threonylcarbamoyladenine synthase|nr:tRNA (adenosine(37)-N6)-threonylcarbamoyltransferase complex transferase subunit TsaD [Candidatus Adiutrix sp.]
MLVLGLESSCDETAAALYEDGLVLAGVVRSQIDLHRRYGGVVPEIAGRAHLEAIDQVALQALAEAGRSLTDLAGLAVTQGPGLVGALLVALSFAKGLGLATGLPVTGVNHVKAHALAPFMARPGEAPPPEPEFPLVALVVSGGHSHLYRMDDFLAFSPLGQTRDDAAGEAFDKTAKLMGLGYPGGQAIERLAARGDPTFYRLSRPLWREGLDFSFSGLKTQVLTIYRRANPAGRPADAAELNHLAAGFQAAVVEVLVDKLRAALEVVGAKGVVLAGGVAANGALRAAAETMARASGRPLYVPPPAWCADNAAMIAHLGARQLAAGLNILDLAAEARPRWPVT